MSKSVADVLLQDKFSKQDLVALLGCNDDDKKLLFEKAMEIKQKYVGNTVYFRGLIEFSNICSKDCLYCGIRKSNKNTERYTVSDEDIIAGVRFAHQSNYASVVLQAGEIDSPNFIDRIDGLLKKMKEVTNNEIGITISLGEQTEETYQRWYDSGAHRYLLRIESTNRDLYNKIHPENAKHDFDKRMESLKLLQKVGYLWLRRQCYLFAVFCGSYGCTS